MLNFAKYILFSVKLIKRVLNIYSMLDTVLGILQT